MPGGDKTGPLGAGPKTGRESGLCSGRVGSGLYLGGGRFAWGCGMGYGGGGYRNRFRSRFFTLPETPTQPIPITDELAELKQQALTLQDSLKQINSRIEALSRHSL